MQFPENSYKFVLTKSNSSFLSLTFLLTGVLFQFFIFANLIGEDKAILFFILLAFLYMAGTLYTFSCTYQVFVVFILNALQFLFGVLYFLTIFKLKFKNFRKLCITPSLSCMLNVVNIFPSFHFSLNLFPSKQRLTKFKQPHAEATQRSHVYT